MQAQVWFVNRFYAPDQSATARLLTELGEDLAAHGYRITILTGRQLLEDPDARLPARESRNGVSICRVWSTRLGRGNLVGRAIDSLTFLAAASAVLLRRVRSSDQVVFLTDPPMLSTGLAWAVRFRGARYLNWLQDLFPEVAARLGVVGERSIAYRIACRLRNRALRKASCNVVIGRLMAAHVDAICPERSTTIPNWVDCRAIKPIAGDANRMRGAWGLDGHLVVAYCGNFGRSHDLSTILDAIASAPPQWRFLFVGGGAQKGLLERAAAQSDGQILVRPYQPAAHLSETLAVADIHLVSLLPELEGLIVPSKIYGVLAAGRPVIFVGSADGEVARLVRDHDVGAVVRAGRSASLLETIKALSDDPERLAAIGIRARQLAEQAHERSIALRRWLTALEPGTRKRHD